MKSINHLSAHITLLLAFNACSLQDEKVQPPPLNSERIEQRFGSYGIDLLEREPVRVSMLYSLHDGRRICRTFALVQFEGTPLPALRPSLEKIRKGASLGATLKQDGWAVAKTYRHLGTLKAGPRFLALAKLSDPVAAAIAIYDLNVSRENNMGRVATVVEIYHPAYLTLEELRKTIKIASANDQKKKDDIRRLLRLAANAMAEPVGAR